MDIRDIFTCLAMFLYSLDGYNAINYFHMWCKYHMAKRGVKV